MCSLRNAFLAVALAVLTVPFVSVITASPAQAVNNSLALTPPMGWNDWNSFGCNVSEQLVEQTADYIISSGLEADGYQYVNIDDCWMSSSRSSSGHLVPS